LPVRRDDVLAAIHAGLHGLASELGLLVAVQLLEDEVTQLCGPRYQRLPDRTHTRYGHQRGQITLAGQQLPIQRPRVRYADGSGEAPLNRYALLQRPEALPESACRRLLRGVSCRDYAAVVEQARDGFGIARSSVSRHFVRATAAEVQRLAERRFEGVRFAAIYIDGVEYAGDTLVVALGITVEGTKHVLGLRQGATENAAVCTSLLEDLAARGVATDQPTLFVLDGAKALAAAVRRVWGGQAVVQRCQVHKLRNVQAHVPKRHWAETKRRLHAAYRETSYSRALATLQAAARWLERLSPDAAASLREGLEETLTVVRLGVAEPLRRTLSTTNPVESALSVTRTATARVKRWQDGDMRQRWCAAGLLRAETKFRRVRGHRHLPSLLKALKALTKNKDLDLSEEAT
jgi:transposase-like protein